MHGCWEKCDGKYWSRKDRWTDGRTGRAKTVYPTRLLRSRGIIIFRLRFAKFSNSFCLPAANAWTDNTVTDCHFYTIFNTCNWYDLNLTFYHITTLVSNVIAITNFLVSHTYEITFHDVIVQSTVDMYSCAKILKHGWPTWPNEYVFDPYFSI